MGSFFLKSDQPRFRFLDPETLGTVGVECILSVLGTALVKLRCSHLRWMLGKRESMCVWFLIYRRGHVVGHVHFGSGIGRRSRFRLYYLWVRVPSKIGL